MPFIPAIGVALGATAGTVTASLVGAAAIGVGAYATSKFIKGLTPPSQPQAPINRNVQAARDLSTAQQTASSDAAEIVRRRRRAGTQTVFTDPLGVSDKANIAKKIVLGE